MVILEENLVAKSINALKYTLKNSFMMNIVSKS